MSDRADFLAGIAASGCGPQFGIYGDFGTFSGPYPDPSPPGGVFGISDYDMSDDSRPSGDEESSDADDSTSEASETDETSKSALKKKKKLDAHAKKQLKLKEIQDRKLKRQMFHLHLDKSPSKAFTSISGVARQNLARISREARAGFGNSKMKKLKHLRWAFQTFTPAGYANYVHILGVDKEMQTRLSHPELDEEPFEEDSLGQEDLTYPMKRIRRSDIKKIKRESNLSHKEQRAAKAARKRERFAAQARPSRKEASTAQLRASWARKEKFQEMVKLSKGKAHEDPKTQKRFYAWARRQLGKKWVPKFNKIFGPA
ncbi:hypothetical protein KCU81_g7826, partial [Aureobasidium melanogenum]|uniref:Uncharacterized protein n=1 Tax=Aureobasidium melanogenum (strain CBS 110374) TaxID=1043003 RepID=A0A074VCL1_AURM1